MVKNECWYKTMKHWIQLRESGLAVIFFSFLENRLEAPKTMQIIEEEEIFKSFFESTLTEGYQGGLEIIYKGTNSRILE